MNEIAIDVKNVTKTYKIYKNARQRILDAIFPLMKIEHENFHAIDDLSFQVKKGEIVGIIGRNGSGKSTILKIITGILAPSFGTIEINGRISALLELGTGFNMEYTGFENIYMNGTIMGISHVEMEKKVPEILEFADIGDFIYQPVKNYSSGMFVRLAFAVAVNVKPDILIVDEALAVGDAAFQAKCMTKMNKLMNSGTTVLFVTHDINTIKSLCQRCIYLQNGRKIMEGIASEVAEQYQADIRASMNKENKELVLEIKEDEQKLNLNNNFMKKRGYFREGSGEVKILNVNLLDTDGNNIIHVFYNQEVKIQILIQFYKALKVGVAYHLYDDKNIELLGSGTIREGKELIKGEENEQFLIEFTTKLPLIEGNYSIGVLISCPLMENKTAYFVDFVHNAVIFEMEENYKNKLWDKIYLQNEVSIEHIEC